jgi:hypothetical protein
MWDIKSLMRIIKVEDYMVLIYVPFQASAMAVDSSGVYALLAG